jgi:3-oxoacyl-[acyl-carrier-protein] synthase-3
MEVFTFSITEVPKLLVEFLKHMGKSQEDYDCFALHQANIYILKQIARKLKVTEDKVPVSLDRYGNNSSNSIPLVLADHYGAAQEGLLRTVMCGFGAGLSWACCEAVIEKSHIHPVIFTDAHFNDVE